jgi:hypothetical protein
MTNFEEITPLLDQHDAETLGTFGPILAQKAVEHWIAEHEAEWTPFNTPYNIELMFGWHTARVVPVTLRNLSYAFNDLKNSGTMKPRPDYQDMLVTHIAQEFAAAHPELDGYFYVKNFDRVQEYMAAHKIELSVEGLAQGFRECIEKRMILPSDRGFITSRKQTPFEKIAANLEREKAEALSPVPGPKFGSGKPLSARQTVSISPKLEQAYRDSLKGTPQKKVDYEKRLRDARVAVGNANPDMDLYSPQFRAAVSDYMAEHQE